MTREETARNYHKSGCNCAQAVAMAFEDKTPFDVDQLFTITEGLGAGGGNMRGTCGALAAAYMIAGMLNSTKDHNEPTSKASTYKINKQLAEKFSELTGAQNCPDLKGIFTGKVLCSCPDCVGYGARVLAEYLGEE